MDMKWLNGFMRMQGECGGGGHISFWRMKDKQIVRVRIGVTVTEPHAKINSPSAALCNGFARVICHPTWNANSREATATLCTDTIAQGCLSKSSICLHNCCPVLWSTAHSERICADAHGSIQSDMSHHFTTSIHYKLDHCDSRHDKQMEKTFIHFTYLNMIAIKQEEQDVLILRKATNWAGA